MEVELGGKSGHESDVEEFRIAAELSELFCLGKVEGKRARVVAAGDVDVVVLDVWLPLLKR